MEEFIKKLGYLDEQDDAWNDDAARTGTMNGDDSPEVEIEMPEIGYKEVTREVEVKKEIGKYFMLRQIFFGKKNMMLQRKTHYLGMFPVLC